MSDEDFSLDDDFLNLRFDPKYKQIFKEKIESQQFEPVSPKYAVPVKLVGSFHEKTAQVLTSMVSRVIKTAGLNGLRLKRSDPEIVFYTETAWLNNNQKTKTNLPASVINWQGSLPIIQVITPGEIKSNEILIKTVRLLFSKLFGALFFHETVLSRKPYVQASSIVSEGNFDLSEKMHFCRLMDDFTKPALERFKSFALNKKLDKNKIIEQGKNEFFKQLDKEQGDINSENIEFLNEIFAHFLQLAKNTPTSFFDLVSTKVFNALPKIGLVLPHEQRSFNSMKQRDQWEVFDGIAEKTQYIKSCINDLLESFSFLEKSGSKELNNFTEFDYWINVLNNRIVHLKRKGLVKLFLIDDSRLTLNQEKARLGFPLWIWRHKIFENYPRDLTSDKVIKLITNQYKNSIYQKLFEALFRAVNCLKQLNKSYYGDFFATSDFKRLKALISGIQVRIPIIDDVLHTCRLSPQILQQYSTDNSQLRNASQSYENGWSYFISFALIHQFYLGRSSERDDRANKFLTIIRQHLESRLEKQVSVEISYLFLLLYQKNKFELESLVEIVKQGSNTMDFFVLNHQKIIGRKAPKIDILKSFVDSILK